MHNPAWKSAKAVHALQLVAGPTARRHLLSHGIRQQDFEVMVGASGGPKWFALYGLDQYLFGEFFHRRRTPLHLIGSSAGAWRFACFAQQQPVAASQRFANAYRDVDFADNASISDVTRTCQGILDAAIPDDAAVTQILTNPVIKLNLIVARARGICATRQPFLQLLSLLLAASANALHRNHLGAFFERVLFHAPDERPPFHAINDLPTHRVALTRDNLRDAIMASGSIPLVLDPVRDIHGAGPGNYYDGGVTDYHFDIPFCDQGLVLYPHFYPTITPGWFDKALRWRRGTARHFDNVLLLCPSPAWVASLPHGKIPDRKDFDRLAPSQRIDNWRTVQQRSHELADEFSQLVSGERDICQYL